jgi:PAS domain S-box-containing protein
VGLAFLSPDRRYIQINERLTEICGVSIAGHIGRSVRETVPQVADQVEKIVQAIVRSGEPIAGVEVRGQRADKLNADHVWITNWHPLKGPKGNVIGVNVVAEDVTERKRAETVLTSNEKVLRESEVRFRELADNISQFAWTANARTPAPASIRKTLSASSIPFSPQNPKALGMGLAICRSIVEAHGGNLAVSPGIPHGSVFDGPARRGSLAALDCCVVRQWTHWRAASDLSDLWTQSCVLCCDSAISSSHIAC